MSLAACKLTILCIYNINVCYKVTISTAPIYNAVVSILLKMEISYFTDVYEKILKFLLGTPLFKNML